jgi:mono/diheme cytochrome c family protein
MALMPLVGLWFLAVIPDDSRGWLLGGSVAMTMFLAIAVGASTLLGLYAVLGILLGRLWIQRATTALLLALAFAATAAGEFVREGVRKPFTIRNVLYSNAVRPDEVAARRAQGTVGADPYPLRGPLPPTAQLVTGAKVFRMQCAVCHTTAGANGVLHLTATWTDEQLRLNLAQLQRTKAFMPPFAGSPAELEALVQWLLWQRAERPPAWAGSDDEALVARIGAWLDEAGVAAGSTEVHR